MSTGVETWNQNLLDIGPMYPFPGTEMWLAIAGIAVWFLWHVYQLRSENRMLENEKNLYSDKAKLKDALDADV